MRGCEERGGGEKSEKGRENGDIVLKRQMTIDGEHSETRHGDDAESFLKESSRGPRRLITQVNRIRNAMER